MLFKVALHTLSPALLILFILIHFLSLNNIHQLLVYCTLTWLSCLSFIVCLFPLVNPNGQGFLSRFTAVYSVPGIVPGAQ